MNVATKYRNRYLAQIDIEAVTPLAIGSGDKDILTDSMVIKDINGLPYIPGTSIAGVVRSAVEIDDKEQLFGFQKRNSGQGSKLIFSDGRLIGKNGKPIDGIYSRGKDEGLDKFVNQFEYLPVRQHVRISAGGSAEKGGKFDEQIVFKGARFRFEIESRSEKDEKDAFLKVLNTLYKSDLRLGSGTRSGFGKIKVISCVWRALDLENSDDRKFYLDKSSSLEDTLIGERLNGSQLDSKAVEYKLVLKPVDFLLIGSGFGDDDADMTSLSETFIKWDNNVPSFQKANLVIPASSLKGALAHRTAFHYNKLSGINADTLDLAALSNYVGDKNEAVACLFGRASDIITCGKVLFSDMIQYSAKIKPVVLNHASIDRFTGGAKDGALYQEKALYGNGETVETSIMVTDTENIKDEYLNAFEMALKDLCAGYLPLGGGSNRGNGCFTGTVYKNGVQI